jgi:hypothetical protein
VCGRSGAHHENHTHHYWKNNGKSPAQQLDDKITEAYLADLQPSPRRRFKRALANNPGKIPGEKLEYEISLKYMYHAPKQNSLIYFALH